ncbi:uncharacterized protein LOC132717689 isoform X3 [Ruditapes philippinarum]|uniref:uncharacterized protein LOC132717689 isoform X3 n=1 Tax=Ruditapes philippinarum TaxID=129788 RepID=UPI00295B600C|nr:uncharacterized protein LOC132717689 isoform X3 [Ruditapes philippinarum]
MFSPSIDTHNFLFRFRFMMFGLIILMIISSTHGELSSNCSVDESCPPDKPFCSEVGCVYECPEPLYINGTKCVYDCGEMFVDDNRNCISACPEQTFYKETLKQTISKSYLERKCVKCDMHGNDRENGKTTDTIGFQFQIE